MPTNSILRRSAAARRLLIAFAALPALSPHVASLRAQNSAPAPAAPAANEPIVLDPVIVSATRTPTDPKHVPSAVTLLSLPEIRAAQIDSLAGALATVPGVAMTRSGAAGAQGSLFVRGANSTQTVFFVDGVPMSTKSATYFDYLGSADLAGLDRIEVLRGPQSTLYGSAGMGGVVLMETAHGCGPVNGQVSATAGSFGTYGGSASVGGGNKTVGASASLDGVSTQNDRDNNDFERTAGSARIEWAVARPVLIGLTTRVQEADYEEPGAVGGGTPGRVESENQLTTVYGELRGGEVFRSRLTLGLHRRDYLYGSAFGESPLWNERHLLEWQNTWAPVSSVEVVAGLSAEDAEDSFLPGTRYESERRSGYVSATVRPVDNVSLTAGARRDDFDAWESADTGRVGGSWFLPSSGTKLRATYGTAFQAPGADDRYGVNYGGFSIQLPNPDVRPERSHGWDAGIDQSFDDGKKTLSATYFRNEFKNLLEFEVLSFAPVFTGRVVNRSRATTEGVELAFDSRWTEVVRTRVAYTCLDATRDDTGERLARRPRHTVDAQADYQATRAINVGTGLNVMASREQFGAKLDDVVTVRLFGSYAVNESLTLRARVENLLDREYEEVPGYPALPIGAYVGAEWRF